ncbi:DUF3526 domain-containing protein [Pedobacter namyangjuensis]|uniref:DUF3526 domain-containing protein n=1 Tax=Pedobacter namyangjuensis TaxID=600626 RepID=UPI000DE247AC|nr:DUF3526 domain-containing protein [Pedobacter namyangjuensis]
MNLFKTIFRFEWIQLKRQYAQLFALALFLIIGCYAVYSGSSVIKHQKTVIDTLNQQYNSDYELAVRKFTDTLTPESKAQAANAGVPQAIDFRLPPVASNQPKGFASLAVGQRDVNPYYQKVRSQVDFLDNGNMELSNPSTLSAGNFDLSFVLVYLLPLLIITLCYGSYAEEKEQGTYALLTIQSASISRIMIYKLLFRAAVVLVVTGLLSSIAFIAAEIIGATSLSDILLWSYITLMYIAFWFAVCYFFIQLKNSSIATALKLVGVWLFFLIALPSITNAYLSLANPVPLRADLASFARHAAEEVWETKPAALAALFNKNNPQYNSSINPAKDSTQNGQRFIVGYYDLLERKVSGYAKAINDEIEARNAQAQLLAKFSPSVTMQYLYNAIAQSGRDGHMDFQRQLSVFQKKWKHHIYSRQLAEVNFTREELKDLPKFTKANPTSSTEILKGSLSIWAGLMLFLLLANWNGKRESSSINL